MTSSITEPTGTGAVEPLGLRAVVTGSLPRTLGTPATPDRYVVEAVFTRRPERAEADAIVGMATAERLAAAGYPGVVLTIADRRLGVGNTNLEELESGLGTALADALAEISAEVASVRDRRAATLHEAAVSEEERAAEVERRASNVHFSRSA